MLLDNIYTSYILLMQILFMCPKGNSRDSTFWDLQSIKKVYHSFNQLTTIQLLFLVHSTGTCNTHIYLEKKKKIQSVEVICLFKVIWLWDRAGNATYCLKSLATAYGMGTSSCHSMSMPISTTKCPITPKTCKQMKFLEISLLLCLIVNYHKLDYTSFKKKKG